MQLCAVVKQVVYEEYLDGLREFGHRCEMAVYEGREACVARFGERWQTHDSNQLFNATFRAALITGGNRVGSEQHPLVISTVGTTLVGIILRSLDGVVRFRLLHMPHSNFSRWKSRQVTHQYLQQPGFDREIPDERIEQYGLRGVLPRDVRLALAPTMRHRVGGSSALSLTVVMPEGWLDERKMLRWYWRALVLEDGVERWNVEEQPQVLGVLPPGDLDATIQPRLDEALPTADPTRLESPRVDEEGQKGPESPGGEALPGA